MKKIYLLAIVIILGLQLYGCKAAENSLDEYEDEPEITTAAEVNETAGAFFNGTEEEDIVREDPLAEEEPPAEEDVVEIDIGEEGQPVGDNLPISRGLVAKMLALSMADKSVINLIDREITFTDTTPSEWYDKYINAAYVFNLVGGDGENYHPTDSLTVAQAQILLDRMDENNKVKIKITDENKDMPISYSLWVRLCNEVLQNKAGESSIATEFGIREVSIIPLATPSNNTSLNPWAMVSDVGAYVFSGLNMDNFIDKKIRVQIKDDEIFSILTVESEKPILTNSYVTETTENTISVFSGGATRTYYYEEGFSVGNMAGRIADVTINSQEAETVVFMDEETVTGIIKRVDSEGLELESGKLLLWEDVKIYGANTSTIRWRSLRNLIVGSSIAEFTLKDGKICAAVIKSSAELKKLRVAITEDGSFSLLHGMVSFTGTTDFVVRIKGKERTYGAGETITITADNKDEYFTDELPRIYVRPTDESGRIQLLSITRQKINPKYRGEIEIAYQNDKFSIVNEVGLEEYLYSVVPSEMPTSHGVEAAMVQAVTARSYAYNQFFDNRYYNYGGNVDDTTLSQVYNNVAETETAIEAVNKTKGQMLSYNGSVVSANFYSTSSGVSTNSGEVWAGGANRQLPTETPEYLSHTKQYWDADFGDLSIEENAATFFKTTDIKAYDAAFSWFRWQVPITKENLTKGINGNLAARYKASPHFIRTLVDGQFLMRPIPENGIGDLVDLEVTRRGKGGNIMEMLITGTEATVRVTTEYNARVLMSPKGSTITRKDGSTLTDFSLLPSGMFVMEKEYEGENLNTITFYGGGYGHGVGMSQNGVKGMLDQGLAYTQILEKYYPGTSIKELN